MGYPAAAFVCAAVHTHNASTAARRARRSVVVGFVITVLCRSAHLVWFTLGRWLAMRNGSGQVGGCAGGGYTPRSAQGNQLKKYSNSSLTS
jgi:uncharacterized membrane protein